MYQSPEKIHFRCSLLKTVIQLSYYLSGNK
jgi:hypothetical protein